MNKTADFFKRFFLYIFFGRVNTSDLELVIPMEELDIERTKQPSSGSKDLSKDQVRNQLIITINRVLVVVCSASFVTIIIYSLFYPDRMVPDVIQNAFFTTLGWFGGALGTFFQTDQKR
jgi:hypothetical protein